MPKGNPNPQKQHLIRLRRDEDDFIHLPLSQESPVTLRLPTVVHSWVKDQGTAWARNVLTRAALAEMGLAYTEEEELDI